MESKVDTRSLVLNMLSETLDKGSLSTDVIKKAFMNTKITERDKAFALSLYTGVLERLYFLDYNIGAYSDVPFEKIKPAVKNILRIGIYQMYFMAVPERAAVSESLRLLDKRRMGSLKGYVNAVLRAIQRQGLKEDVPDHIRACVPKWMYDRVSADIGKKEADEFFSLSLKEPSGITASLNTALAPKEEIIKSLKEDGADVSFDEKQGVCLIAFKGDLKGLCAFKNGYIYIQSANSVKAAKAAKALCQKEDPLIMDVCASPGGKSIDLSFMFPKARIISRDKSEDKIRKIEENIKRLGIRNIKTQVRDARVFDEEYREKADIVIVDAPCSGIGVIGNKPDIKHRLKEEDIDGLCELQRQILSASSGYVKAGGVLIYSTCTLLKEENELAALWFEENFAFTKKSTAQYTQYNGRADGFYVAGFAKN